MLNVCGKTSLRAFIGANGMLVLFLPSIVSPAYRYFISDWWIYMLTIYVLLSIVVTRCAFKDYHFKVSMCLDVGHLMCSFTHVVWKYTTVVLISDAAWMYLRKRGC